MKRKTNNLEQSEEIFSNVALICDCCIHVCGWQAVCGHTATPQILEKYLEAPERGA